MQAIVDNRTIVLYTDIDVAVARDTNSRIIHFKLNRYFDNIDLTTKQARVAFINSMGKTGIDETTLESAEDEFFTISWTITSTTLAEAGRIYFALEFTEKVEEKVTYRWQTVPATFDVLEGIVVKGDAVAASYLKEMEYYRNNDNFSLTDLIDDGIPIYIYNRTITMGGIRDLVVNRDHLSQIISFRMTRFFDGVDLSQKLITIKFINADGKGDRTSAVNKVIMGDVLEFGWILDSKLTFKPGEAQFAIEVLGFNANDQFYSWNTRPAQIFVEYGLNVDEIIPEPGPSWMQSIYGEISRRADNLVYENDQLQLTASGTKIGSPIAITSSGGDHSTLTNLEYDNSGHIGFTSAEELRDHEETVASYGILGHIKIDNSTIQLNQENQIAANVDMVAPEITVETQTDEEYKLRIRTLSDQFVTPNLMGADGYDGVTGATGATGPTGPTGQDGTGVTILGSYDTYEQLVIERPIGNIGDAYLVNGDLYVWSEVQHTWINVGNIRGPIGPTGETGPQGNPTTVNGISGETIELIDANIPRVGGGTLADLIPGETVGSLVNGVQAAGEIPWDSLLSQLHQTNYVINGGMEISQRGTAFAIPNGTIIYTADRFMVGASGVDIVAHVDEGAPSGSLSSKYLVAFTTTVPSVASAYSVRQYVENLERFAGKTVTMSAKILVSLGHTSAVFGIFINGAWVGIPASVPVTGGWVTVTQTLTLPQEVVKPAIVCLVQVPAGATLGIGARICDVQLILGDKIGPYTPRPYAQELLLCQRYYEKSYPVGTKPGTYTQMGLSGASRVPGNVYRAVIHGGVYKVDKRDRPTATIYSETGTMGHVSEYDHPSVVVSASSIRQNTRTIGDLLETLGGGQFVDNYYVFHWTADAEIY